MTKNCWGSPVNHLTSRWLADAILRAVDVGSITYNDIHFGTDEVIWNILIHHEDPLIQKKMDMVLHYPSYFSFVDFSDPDAFIIKSKFRGIDPWIAVGSSNTRITEIDDTLRDEYLKTKEIVTKGWAVKIPKEM
jgi:hypothetical protein